MVAEKIVGAPGGQPGIYDWRIEGHQMIATSLYGDYNGRESNNLTTGSLL